MASVFFPLKASRHRRESSQCKSGFTLIEMLVSVTILVVILGILFMLTQQTATVYKSTNGKIESFRAARSAFESMTRNLSLAALNNYYDYVNSSGQTFGQAYYASGTTGTFTFSPATYSRASDLHFISGWTGAGGSTILPSTQITQSVFFQAPLGYTNSASYQNMANLLNACGYYIQYSQDPASSSYTSFFPTTYNNSYRYRLMEFIQPSEALGVYAAYTANSATETNWIASSLGTYSHQLAPNIIALVILPRNGSGDPSSTSNVNTSITTNYLYDSRYPTSGVTYNQLPPVVEVVMVAIDEASAIKICTSATQPTVITSVMTNLFQDPSKLDTDLQKLTTALTTAHINYRVFQTLVPMHSSKWSTQ